MPKRKLSEPQWVSVDFLSDPPEDVVKWIVRNCSPIRPTPHLVRVVMTGIAAWVQDGRRRQRAARVSMPDRATSEEGT